MSTLTWGTYRTKLRRQFLSDTQALPAKQKWVDEVLLDLLHDALDTFCAHTAVATSVSYDAETAVEFTLPGNVYSPIMTTGMVYWDKDNIEPEYLSPVSVTGRSLTPPVGYFSEHPAGTLLTNADNPAGSGYTLYLHYFAYYNHPISDEATIDVPTWALKALGYDIAANALTSFAMKEANIGQWRAQPEKGSQESHSLAKQQMQLFKIYEQELSRRLRQNRATYWKEFRG